MNVVTDAIGAVIAGRIEGPETVDDLLDARAGRTLGATMHSDNTAAYFNAIPPGADVARGAARSLYLHNRAWSMPASDAVSASKRADLWTVTMGDEVYEIPAAVISGG